MYITPHAIERYRERTGSTRPDDRCQERIRRIVLNGKRIGRCSGGSRYTDGELVAIVAGGNVVTVMRMGKK